MSRSSPQPLFRTKPKGTEQGWHKAFAAIAVAFLTIAFRSRSKAQARWASFATLLPDRDGWILYRVPVGSLPAHLIAHENRHVRDADTIGRWLFCTLYLVSPLILPLLFVSPWFALLVLLPVLNPARAWIEWRAYRAELEYLEGTVRDAQLQSYAERIPRLIAGPDYLFASPLLGLILWLKFRGNWL